MIFPKPTNNVEYYQIKTNKLLGLDRKSQIKRSNNLDFGFVNDTY